MAESKLSVSSISSKPLLGPRKYHYCVLYNYHEGPSSHRPKDHQLAYDVLNTLIEQSAKSGYDKVMYFGKALPGRNIFDILQNMMDESEKIVLLLTPEFLHDGWHKYEQNSTMKRLLDRNEAYKRSIPIAINMPISNIPDNLGLTVSNVICLDYGNNKSEADCWERVTMALESTEIHYEQTRERLTPSAPQMTQENLLHPNSASAKGGPKSWVYRMILWLWELFEYMNSG